MFLFHFPVHILLHLYSPQILEGWFSCLMPTVMRSSTVQYCKIFPIQLCQYPAELALFQFWASCAQTKRTPRKHLHCTRESLHDFKMVWTCTQPALTGCLKPWRFAMKGWIQMCMVSVEGSWILGKQVRRGLKVKCIKWNRRKYSNVPVWKKAKTS